MACGISNPGPLYWECSLSHLDHQESPKVLVSNDCEFLLLPCKLDSLDMKEEIAGEASQGYGERDE